MKSWMEKLKDPSRDVYERRYRLVSLLSILSLFVWILVVLIAEGFTVRILFFGICDLLFVPTMISTLRTGKIQRGAGASAVVLVFLMVPFAFVFNGGIFAGAPNWGIIALVFITMTVRGKLRNFLLAADIAVIVVCYALSWMFPTLIRTFTETSAYVDSVASVVITGIMVSSMFLFLLYMHGQERELLEKRQKEVLELNRAQNRFFSNMSHEIRTPVNTIVGLNEMILRSEVSEEVAENAGQVHAAGKMLLHLVNDILDLSRLESGQMKLVREPYQLGDLLSELVGMVWSQARAKGIAFHVDVDPALPASFLGDEMRIRQILLNVLGNAVKYTKKGSVTLSVQKQEERGGQCVIGFSVTDTGIGIRKENIPTLFQAFRRVDTEENRPIEGTGLGLSIVREFTELMGGRVSVNSVYTQGSTFLIELPQEIYDSGTIGTIDLEKHRQHVRKHAGLFEAPGAKVLVVDDNAANRMVVTRLLRESKMQMDTAENGVEALEKTLYTKYDLIFMDHLMPEMDGVACLNQLRKQPGGFSREAKVVALTANAGADSRQYYKSQGFDGYLAKPCSGEELERECISLLPKELVHVVRNGGEITESSIRWMTEEGKKSAFVITTDSIADFPAAVIRRYRIGIIPHIVHTEEGNFQDGREIDANGVIAYMEEGGKKAATLSPGTAAYESFFADQLSRANHVLHISISSRISGSGYPHAVEAARAFHNVTVVDSRNLSSGEGLLVIRACELAEQGLSADEIVRRLEKERGRIRTSFIMDNMDYLERANLTRSGKAKLFKTLMMHPVLRVRQGEIRVARFYFGSLSASRKRYISAELRRPSVDHGILFVTCAGLSQRDLKMIQNEMEHFGGFAQIYYQKASPAIAANCGPGTVGLIYLQK